MFCLRPLRAIPLAALLLSACDHDGGAPDEQAIAELSERHACADLVLVAADADGTAGLFLTIDDGLVDEVWDRGEGVGAVYQIGDPRIELRWVTGSNVYAGHCGLDNGEPWQVDAVEQAIAGEVELELDFDADSGAISLDLEIRDVLLATVVEDYAEVGPGHEFPGLVLVDLPLDQ